MEKRSWIIVSVIVLIGLTVWWVSKDYNPGPPEGALAPEFTLSNQNQKEVSLKNFRGKVVLLNFWATWCAPCVAEMDSLEKLKRHFEGKPFEVIAISMDEDGWKPIEAFLKKIPVTFTILNDKDYSVSDRYGTYRVPETYLIDAEGRIVEKILGAQNWMAEGFLKKIEAKLPTSSSRSDS